MSRQLWLMLRKDLLRQLRSPIGVGFTLAFPLLFSGLLALTFGGAGSSGQFRVPLLIEDRDQSLISRLLVSSINDERILRFFAFEHVGAEGLARLEEGQAAALLRIPESFGDDFLAGQPLELELIRNPAQGILPEIAEQSATVLTDVLSSSSYLFREPLGDVGRMLQADPGPSAAEVAAVAGVSYTLASQLQEVLEDPPVWIDTAIASDEGEVAGDDSNAPARSQGLNVFLFVLPGISVWSLFLLGDLAMRDIMAEDAIATLKRQLAGPLSARRLVVGKALFAATLASISLVFLASIAALVGGQVVSFAGFLLLSAALIVAVTGFAAVMYGATRTLRQGATLSSAVLLLFAFIGGSFIPIDSLPQGAQRLAPLSLFYWGTEGYRALLQGAGVAGIGIHVAVLAGIGGLLLAAGGMLLDRKVSRA